MRIPNTTIRKSSWADKNQNEFSNDVRKGLEAIQARTELFETEALNSTTLLLKSDRQPMAIELIRCQLLANLNLPIANGTCVSFVWMPTSGGSSITKIQDLPVDNLKYRLLFRITYE